MSKLSDAKGLSLALESIQSSGKAIGLFALMIGAIFFAMQVSHAQQQTGAQTINSIEVLVDDVPLTSLDINERLYFMAAVSGGVRNQEELDKLRETVIETMVNEQLQLKEAAKYNQVISPQELEDFFVRRAAMLNMTPQKFESELARIGSSKRSFLKQIEAQLAWETIVNGLLGSQITVLDDEVDATIDRIKANKGKYEYRLSEILLLVNNPAQEASVRQTAEQIVSSLKAQGVQFENIARQISASSTASVGGDLGWVLESDLDPSLAAEIQKLEIEDITDPISTPGSYRIYKLNDRRRVLSPDVLDEVFTLKQIGLPQDKISDPQSVAEFESLNQKLKAQTYKCEAADSVIESAGFPKPAESAQVPLKRLNPLLRNSLKSLQVGGMTDILSDASGSFMFMVCGREMPEIPEPNFDAILRQMEEQRLAVIARRHLRDLRRNAIIDQR